MVNSGDVGGSRPVSELTRKGALARFAGWAEAISLLVRRASLSFQTTSFAVSALLQSELF
jgi:hypothetical protein